MTEKPKKSKKRISQWQFLLAWIGGQFIGFYLLASLTVIPFILLSFFGLSFQTTGGIASHIALATGGVALGWVSGWAQQWAIYKHFGRYIRRWRTISAILTSIAMIIVQPLVLWSATAYPIMFANATTYPLIVAATFMALFGAAGLGQAILLRKHIKHSWLFFLSTLVGGIIYGLPILGNSSYFIAQIAQYSVTAFAIIWLFQMSGTMDAMHSEDEALERLSDAETDEDYDDYHGEDEKHQRDNRFTRFLRGLRLTFSQ